MKIEWGQFRELGGEMITLNLERFEERCKTAFRPHEGKERTRCLNELMPPLITTMAEIKELMIQEILGGAEEGEILNPAREIGDPLHIRNFDRERFEEAFRSAYLKKLAETEDFVAAEEYYLVNVCGQKRDIEREYQWLSDLVRYPARAKKLPESVRTSLLDFVGNDVPALAEKELELT